MGLEREPILLVPPDSRLTAEILRSLDHAAGDGMILAACGDPCPNQTVVHAHPRPRCSSSCVATG